MNRYIPIRYRTRNQMEIEKEDLTIAGEFEEAMNVKELSTLLREGMIEEFYKIANKVLMIKRNNPVVSKIKREVEGGDIEIFEEKRLVERAIAEYFTDIYKKPYQMRVDFEISNNDDDAMMEDNNHTSALFEVEDIKEAVKYSNFNKGLGPDCFDGNALKSNDRLNDKIIQEITRALNEADIP